MGNPVTRTTLTDEQFETEIAKVNRCLRTKMLRSRWAPIRFLGSYMPYDSWMNLGAR